MPELEAVAPERQCRERRGQTFVVSMEVLRKLPEDRSHLRRADERFDPLVEALDTAFQVGQALHMREVAARLDGEEEPGRRLGNPGSDRIAPGKAVEGAVDLDGVEELCVLCEPA